MNKYEILEEVKNLKLPKDEFYIEKKSALVLRDIINESDVVDICTTNELYEKLKQEYKLIANDNRHIILGKLEIRGCKKSIFEMEESHPYNLESIFKRLYIMIESNNDDEIIEKIKTYVGPSFLYVNNIDEYEEEKRNGANVEQRDNRGETPIFRAVRNENIILVSKMLQDGANVNVLNAKGHNLSEFCDNEEIMKLLIKNGFRL